MDSLTAVRVKLAGVGVSAVRAETRPLGVTPLTLTVKEGDKLYLRFQATNFEPEVREEVIGPDTAELFVLFKTPIKKADPTSEPGADPIKIPKNPGVKNPGIKKVQPPNNNVSEPSGPDKFIDPFAPEKPKK